MVNLTVSHRLKNNLINLKDYKNFQHFAKKENMLLRTIPLKDGTSAILLANQDEFDCLIMQNGKIVASKGCIGQKTDEPCCIAMKVYDHVKKKNLASDNVKLNKEWFSFLDEFIYRFM